MRTIDEMQLIAEDVIARATDRSAEKIPTPLEVQLSGDNLRLIMILRHADKHIADGFFNHWNELLKNLQMGKLDRN